MKLFHGWYVVAVAFVVMMVGSGVAIYNLSVYLHAFVATGRFTVAQVSLASATFTVTAGVWGLAVGRLVERLDVRVVVVAGAAMMAAALAALPWIATLWQVYAFYVLLGAGFATTALIPCTTVVARWFVERRSSAMTLATTGNSFGALTVTPGSALLVVQSGLGVAGLVLAAATLAAIVPAVVKVFRSYPAELGLQPLGGTATATARAAAPSPPTRSDALRSRYFWLCTFAFLCGMTAQTGAIAHLYNLAAERTGPTVAALAVSVLGVSSILARFLAAWALARMTPRAFVVVVFVAQAAGLVACAAATTPAALLASVVVLGSTIGNVITLHSILLADAFGAELYPRLYADSRFWMTFGTAAGPAVIGLLHDSQQGYLGAFVAIAACSLAGIAAIGAMGPRPTSATG